MACHNYYVSDWKSGHLEEPIHSEFHPSQKESFWLWCKCETSELSVTYSLMALMRLEISFYAANIRGENSLLLFILSKRLGWISANFPLRFESPRDLCCLQPWQHSVYQLCRCVWDHLRTLLLVVIVAKVSNYSIKKSRSSTSRASTQLKYWNAKGYQWAFPALPRSGRPQKLSMEANSAYVGTVHNKYWQKMPEFTQK